MPSPAYRGYTTKIEELVKAERNVGGPISTTATEIIYGAEAGELIKHHIAWKYTIDVQWRGLSAQEKNTIMNATSGEWFLVDFIDMNTDQLVEGIKMYRGTGQTITGYGKFKDQQFRYYDVSMSLIQK